jgi:hypothetical protein
MIKNHHLTGLEKAFAVGQIRNEKHYGKLEEEAEKKVGKNKILRYSVLVNHHQTRAKNL